MNRNIKDPAELIQSAGRADGWKDFIGMYNPAMSGVLRTGSVFLPDFDELAPDESNNKKLMPIIIGRLLRKSNRMKVQNWFVAESPHVQEDKLEFLFLSTNDSETIEAGSTSENHRIRAAIAANLNTSIPVLNGLAMDEDKSVRQCVINNPRTPVSDLEFLMHDIDKDIRIAARKKLNNIMGESWVLARFGPESQ